VEAITKLKRSDLLETAGPAGDDRWIVPPSDGWTWSVHNCPNCGAEVHLGMMSLRATCLCGWWWNDEEKRWVLP